MGSPLAAVTTDRATASAMPRIVNGARESCITVINKGNMADRAVFPTTRDARVKSHSVASCGVGDRSQPSCRPAAGELVGCYALWTWVRDERSPLFLLLATGSLLFFAWCLTRTPVAFAGRAFAAYAGIYLLGALGWMMAVDRIRPDRWDLLGGALALLGSLVIVWGPRGSTP